MEVCPPSGNSETRPSCHPVMPTPVTISQAGVTVGGGFMVQEGAVLKGFTVDGSFAAHSVTDSCHSGTLLDAAEWSIGEMQAHSEWELDAALLSPVTIAPESASVNPESVTIGEEFWGAFLEDCGATPSLAQPSLTLATTIPGSGAAQENGSPTDSPQSVTMSSERVTTRQQSVTVQEAQGEWEWEWGWELEQGPQLKCGASRGAPAASLGDSGQPGVGSNNTRKRKPGAGSGNNHNYSDGGSGSGSGSGSDSDSDVECLGSTGGPGATGTPLSSFSSPTAGPNIPPPPGVRGPRAGVTTCAPPSPNPRNSPADATPGLGLLGHWLADLELDLASEAGDSGGEQTTGVPPAPNPQNSPGDATPGLGLLGDWLADLELDLASEAGDSAVEHNPGCTIGSPMGHVTGSGDANGLGHARWDQANGLDQAEGFCQARGSEQANGFDQVNGIDQASGFDQVNGLDWAEGLDEASGEWELGKGPAPRFEVLAELAELMGEQSGAEPQSLTQAAVSNRARPELLAELMGEEDSADQSLTEAGASGRARPELLAELMACTEGDRLCRGGTCTEGDLLCREGTCTEGERLCHGGTRTEGELFRGWMESLLNGTGTRDDAGTGAAASAHRQCTAAAGAGSPAGAPGLAAGRRPTAHPEAKARPRLQGDGAPAVHRRWDLTARLEAAVRGVEAAMGAKRRRAAEAQAGPEAHQQPLERRQGAQGGKCEHCAQGGGKGHGVQAGSQGHDAGTPLGRTGATELGDALGTPPACQGLEEHPQPTDRARAGHAGAAGPQGGTPGGGHARGGVPRLEGGSPRGTPPGDSSHGNVSSAEVWWLVQQHQEGGDAYDKTTDGMCKGWRKNGEKGSAYFLCSCCNKLKQPSTRGESPDTAARKKVYSLGAPGLYLVCFYGRHLPQCTNPDAGVPPGLSATGVPGALAHGGRTMGIPWALSPRERELLLDPAVPGMVKWRTQVPCTWTGTQRTQHLAQHTAELQDALLQAGGGQDAQAAAALLGRVRQHFAHAASG